VNEIEMVDEAIMPKSQGDIIKQANDVNLSVPFTDASMRVSRDRSHPFKTDANIQNTYSARTGASDVNYQASIIDDMHLIDQSQSIPEANNVMKGPYFCPKRFNRFPRFSIFIKDDHNN